MKGTKTLLDNKKSFLNNINDLMKERNGLKLPSIKPSRPSSR